VEIEYELEGRGTRHQSGSASTGHSGCSADATGDFHRVIIQTLGLKGSCDKKLLEVESKT
jgi:hypothetical protein